MTRSGSDAKDLTQLYYRPSYQKANPTEGNDIRSGKGYKESKSFLPFVLLRWSNPNSRQNRKEVFIPV